MELELRWGEVDCTWVRADMGVGVQRIWMRARIYLGSVGVGAGIGLELNRVELV